MPIRNLHQSLIAGCAVALVGMAHACADPTQVTVVITTDIPCAKLGGVTIGVANGSSGGGAPATSTTSCDDSGKVGTVVLVPRGAKDSLVSVELVAGIERQAESCLGAGFGPGCVVSRRALSYIPSTPLTLPIVMRSSCSGVVCPDRETCVAGVCRVATVDPSACQAPEGCSESTLGIGTTKPFDAGLDASTPATPSISGYENGACVTFGRGKTWCWGNNQGGIAGDGTTGGLRTPALVKTSATHVQVAVTRSFACARTMDGLVECWGGAFGPTPTRVTALKGVTSLGGGQEHMCAVLEAGTVSCWGRNTSSQASGDPGNRNAISATSPVVIPLPGAATAVSGGLEGSCALLASGRVRCWGLGGSGEIGVGSLADAFRPDTDVSGITDAVEINGGFFGTCARLRNGDAYCWGRTSVGDAPCDVAGNATTPRKIAAGVAAVGGTLNKGGCLILASGSPMCWSLDNASGELGVGFFGSGALGTKTCLPGIVPGITTAVAIDSRSDSVWVVLADDTVRAWGNDGNGQLGDGLAGPNQSSPVQVRLP